MAEWDFYLASASPRRAALLDQIGARYRRLPVDADETPRPGEAPAEFAARMALEKARLGWARLEPAGRAPVLGADTVVTVDGAILGKPRDRDDAVAMLQRLSGRSHQVLSAVSVVEGDTHASALNTSTVWFRSVSAEECAAYWETGEPRDKAGAYAVQGIGAVFIERLEGSYSGVMGLPLFETAQLLERFGIAVLGQAPRPARAG